MLGILLLLRFRMVLQCVGEKSQVVSPTPSYQQCYSWFRVIPGSAKENSFPKKNNGGGQSRPRESDLSLTNYDVLVTTGLGALRGQEVTDEISSIKAARDLVMRSIMVWIAVLALLTLGGWLG